MSFAPSLRLLKQSALLPALLGLFWLGYQARRGWQFQHLFAPKRIVENFRGMHKLFNSNLIRNTGPVSELGKCPTGAAERLQLRQQAALHPRLD